MAIKIETESKKSGIWNIVILVLIAISLVVFVTYNILDTTYDFKKLKKEINGVIDSTSIISAHIELIESDKIITLQEIEDLKKELITLEYEMRNSTNTNSIELERALEILKGQ